MAYFLFFRWKENLISHLKVILFKSWSCCCQGAVPPSSFKWFLFSITLGHKKVLVAVWSILKDRICVSLVPHNSWSLCITHSHYSFVYYRTCCDKDRVEKTRSKGLASKASEQGARCWRHLRPCGIRPNHLAIGLPLTMYSCYVNLNIFEQR